MALYCGDRVVHAPLPAGARYPPFMGTRPRARGVRSDVARARAGARSQSLAAMVRAHRRWLRGCVSVRNWSACCAGLTNLRAPVLIMANGSWEGDPGDSRRVTRRPGDLFAFKANFSRSRLAPGLLPVISFAGGYGGLVIAENGELTLAGCIRRDALRACRAAAPGQTAGEAFERYLRASTAALRDALAGARREGAWLGIGPIQPGIRAPWSRADGRFMIGNAAAEAHPIIGEGISMAMQSAWLLCVGLIAAGRSNASADTLRTRRRRICQPVEAGVCAAPAPGRDACAPGNETLAGADCLAAHRASSWLMTAMARGAGKARVPPAFQGALPLDRLASLEDAN